MNGPTLEQLNEWAETCRDYQVSQRTDGKLAVSEYHRGAAVAFERVAAAKSKAALDWVKTVEGWFYEHSQRLDTARASEAGFFGGWYQRLGQGKDPVEALLRAYLYVGTQKPEMREEIKELLRGRPGSLAKKPPRLGAPYSLIARLDKALEGCGGHWAVMNVDAALLLDLRGFVDGGFTGMNQQLDALSARAELVDQRLQDFELGHMNQRVAEAAGMPERVLSEDLAVDGGRPNIICLCGSSRFVAVMAVLAWKLEKKGNIVLSLHLLPLWYGAETDHQAEAEGVAEFMDKLHLRKIDMADEVVVVDVEGLIGSSMEGYIGDSTAREIEYAQGTLTPLRYLSKEPELLGLMQSA